MSIETDRRNHRHWLPLTLVSLVLLALSLAGCGRTDSPGVASFGSTTTSAAPAPPKGNSGGANVATQLRYAQCMQSHGIHDFPEPGGDPTAITKALQKLDPSSPTFQAAQKACTNLLPKGAPVSIGESAKIQDEALKFARCMQTHGMTKWPDPSSRGYEVAPAGAAASSPTFLKAAKICRPLLPSG